MLIIAMTGGRVNRSRRHSKPRQSWIAQIRLDPILDFKFERSGGLKATAPAWPAQDFNLRSGR